ncbi:unnamed protein product [Prorocentrum cordatum]|uniref:Lipase maturation factor n=1 Tax=Prorocentrum cordatum TaxID=2364126 RepID=A0ABN9PE89_9DINO|nr:unnamed protein product [Polarella glacialis]
MLAVLAAPAGLMGCSSPGSLLPAGAAPPLVASLAFRWLAFRIMLGAGLIKARGAKCWLDLTAMCHHIETQPIPNPWSRAFHTLPRPALLFMTACNHVIELVAPWLLLVPWTPAQATFGAAHIVFQFSLILTGNLSFLNWLTIVPGLWCFDDATLVGLLPQATAEQAAAAVAAARAASDQPWLCTSSVAGTLRSCAAVAAIAWLSVPVYNNLLGPRGGGKQRMNSGFERRVTVPAWLLRLGLVPATVSTPGRRAEDGEQAELAQKRRRLEGGPAELSVDLCSLRLLNTYGAFGSVNLERVEIVFEGSRDGIAWLPYTFKAAVDDPMKRPRWLSPYHLRLDWCRWIASCRGRRSSGLQEPWALAFVRALLEGDAEVRALLARGGDPFASGAPLVRGSCGRSCTGTALRRRRAPPRSLLAAGARGLLPAAAGPGAGGVHHG